jgi:adenylate kinase family enzyme
MKGLEFPIIGTKTKGVSQTFDLASPAGRQKYFQAKAGDEITSLKKYLRKNTFIAYFLGKKNSGKGTYSQLFTEIFGTDKVAHISVGDVVRDADANWNNISKSKKIDQLKSYYRGFISFEDAVNALTNRTTTKLLPTEFILALLKLYITEHEGKTIFLDGLPRELDQVSYSLYFRDLINYRDDPDLFILIDIPESVIAERLKHRVICPKCFTSRNTKLNLTSKLGYDSNKKEIYLICDNPHCSGERMVPKEGDELGLDPLRPRLKKDENILKKAFDLHGIPKVFLRNHVPISLAKKYFDHYEITPEYVLNWDAKNQKVKVTEKPWIIKDDNRVPSHSLLAPPVIVSLLKQLPEVLNL